MTSSASANDLIARSSFVFRGTVESLGTVTTAAVAASEQSATVRVTEVLRAPQPLRRYAGQLITVELASTEGVQQGSSFIFFTQPRLFADTLVVREIGRQAEAAAAAEATASMHDTLVRLATGALENRIAQADSVVVGRVATVRPSLIAAATPGMLQPTSEHDPDWHEAVVQVASVISGTAAPDSPVTILFPASIDVAWYQSPKYAPGQAGVFLLHTDQVPAAAAEMVGPTYTSLHPQDFQAAEQEPRVRALIERLRS
jgi:hypothetical protein